MFFSWRIDFFELSGLVLPLLTLFGQASHLMVDIAEDTQYVLHVFVYPVNGFDALIIRHPQLSRGEDQGKLVQVLEKKDIDALKDRIKYAGFGEELGKELETKIKEGKEAFQLQHSASIGEKKMNYNLNFRKSEKNGQYYFNSFDAELTKPDGKTQSQTFYQNQNISAKEAFNLLEWRSVYKTLFNKDGERYNAWLQLDLAGKNDKGLHPMQQYHDKYGFELEKALGKLPIVEMEGMDPKDRLVSSF